MQNENCKAYHAHAEHHGAAVLPTVCGGFCRRQRRCGGCGGEHLDGGVRQIKSVVNKVVFPAIDMILAIFFFVKLGTAYFDYRKTGQFEWTAPAILFACLVFTLTAPLYIWGIIGV